MNHDFEDAAAGIESEALALLAGALDDGEDPVKDVVDMLQGVHVGQGLYRSTGFDADCFYIAVSYWPRGQACYIDMGRDAEKAANVAEAIAEQNPLMRVFERVPFFVALNPAEIDNIESRNNVVHVTFEKTDTEIDPSEMTIGYEEEAQAQSHAAAFTEMMAGDWDDLKRPRQIVLERQGNVTFIRHRSP